MAVEGKDIFLSYATKNRDFVEKIKCDLEQRTEYSIWMDKDEIRGGNDWEKEIESNLRQCKVLIVTITTESNNSKWVQRECIFAENLEKKRIPLLRSGDAPPFRLIDLQFIDFRCEGMYKKGLEALIDVLKEYIPANNTAINDSNKKKGRKSQKKRVNMKQQKGRTHKKSSKTKESIKKLLFCVPHSWVEGKIPSKNEIKSAEKFLSKAKRKVSRTEEGGEATGVCNFLKSLKKHLRKEKDYKVEIQEVPGKIVLKIWVANRDIGPLHFKPNARTLKLLLEGINGMLPSLQALGGEFHPENFSFGGTYDGSVCILFQAPEAMIQSFINFWKDKKQTVDLGNGLVLTDIYSLFTASYNDQQQMPDLLDSSKDELAAESESFLDGQQKHPLYRLGSSLESILEGLYHDDESQFLFQDEDGQFSDFTAYNHDIGDDYTFLIPASNDYFQAFIDSDEDYWYPMEQVDYVSTYGNRETNDAQQEKKFPSFFTSSDPTFQMANDNDIMASVEDSSDVVITVFQASPLAYEDYQGNSNPLQVLDLESEEEDLRDALKKTAVRLRVEVATVESLGRFFAQGGKIFHFSGHGNDKYLVVENNHGGAHFLLNEQLKALIQAGGSRLNFAFIASDNSRTAGQIFIEAGVRHVICTQANQSLSHYSLFVREFYSNLSNGRTIKSAFEMARHVMHAGSDQKTEAETFLLLPELDCHDVVLFSGLKEETDSPVCVLDFVSASKPSSSLLPLPPEPFLGREIDMYMVLKSLVILGERLVTVTGKKGIGKASFAKAIGHFMDRRKMWGEVHWIPFFIRPDSNDVGNLLSNVVQIIENHTSTDSFQVDAAYQAFRGLTFELHYSTKAVVIIDATKFQEAKIQLLSFVLHDLLEHTKQVKLLLVHNKEVAGLPVSQGTQIELKKLDVESTMILFVRKCRHASQSSWSKENLIKQYNKYPQIVSKVLGGGNPTKTILFAMNITQEEYLKLVDSSVAITESDFSQVLSHLPPK